MKPYEKENNDGERKQPMKKVISLMLALVLALSLTACGGSSTSAVSGAAGPGAKADSAATEAKQDTPADPGPQDDTPAPAEDLDLSELEDVDSDDAITQKIMDFMKSCAGRLKYQVGEATVVLGGKAQELLAGKGVGERKVTVGIRPEHIAFAAAPGSDTVSSKVDVSEMMGSEVYLHVNAVGRDVVLRIPTTDLPAEHRAGIPYGTEINFAFRPDLIHLFDPETEKNLMY